MEREEAKVLFKDVMNELFPNTNQNFTFENFDNYINDDSELDEKGIYIVRVKEGCAIELVSDIYNPEGPTSYKGKLIIDSRNFNSKKIFQDRLTNSDNEFLYIGSTPSESEEDNTLKDRLTDYKDFGASRGNTDIRHSGGKRIWFIKNNKKNLVIDYIGISSLKENFNSIYQKAKEIKTTEEKNEQKNLDSKKNKKDKKKHIVGYIEAGLIFLHEMGYGDKQYPFANEKCECKDTKDVWYSFWKNFKID